MYNSPPTSRIPPWLRPGLLAAAFLVAIGLAALLALLLQGGDVPAQRLADPYLWHVLRFTFWQATLATALAVTPAIFLARALQRRHFPGRDLLLRFATMTLALPTLVAISGILGVYGKQGWLAHIWQGLGGDWRFRPYGLTGILLVHQFFALPLATRLLLNTLEQIPGEQRQLAAQLGVRGWPLFRHLEWPWLRRQLPPVAALIYMLCFTSFSTILILGGGPKATTVELAIYQALPFTYEPDRSAPGTTPRAAGIPALPTASSSARSSATNCRRSSPSSSAASTRTWAKSCATLPCGAPSTPRCASPCPQASSASPSA